MSNEKIPSLLARTYPNYRSVITEPIRSYSEEERQPTSPAIKDNKEEEKLSNLDQKVSETLEVIKVDKAENLWSSIESKLSYFKSKSLEKLSRISASPDVMNENSIIFTILIKLEILFEKFGNNDFNDFLLFQTSTFLGVFSENGKSFEGFFDQKFENGFSVVKTKKFKYVGSIVNKKFEGMGAMLYEVEGLYIGNWKNGKRDGYGRHTWPDGSEYNGNFVEGNMQGIGTFIYTKEFC